MDSSEYFEINSNITLDYINQILMEDGTNEKVSIHQQHDTLQAMEKPFYDILGQAYPSSSRDTLISSESQINFPNCINNYCRDQSCSGSIISDSHVPNVTKVIDTYWASELDNAIFQFNRGAEEAKKLVPSVKKLVIDIESNDLFASKTMTGVTTGQQSKHVNRIRSHPNVDLELLEERRSKQSAISTCETIRDETFDRVLLCDWQLRREICHLRKMKAKEPHKCPQSKGYNQGQDKQQKEAVDLRALLIQCAQAIASNDCRFASQLLKKIRNHSCPSGDGFQRMAAYFADGLEARLAGTGSQMCKKLMGTRTRVRDMLKAYRLFIAACPFTRVAYYFSNQTIVDVLEGRPRLHIIDFGIMFGFQWPSLIQRFAKSDGGPPKLRITGIDVPETGFRPGKKIEETGKRLAEYAKMFNVPFQYQGIASRWENISIEDINLDKDEVLIINCLHRMQNLGDEAEDMDSARDKVLRDMRKMNPEVLIIGIMNGSYSSPFFLPRFKEVLFNYSSLFDMLNTTVAKNHEARIMIERDILGADVLNVVACEGAERSERPESYKQWRMRCLKAGLKQLPVNQAILKRSTEGKEELYHEDFIINEDNGWLLQGWKGRILHALSSWKPQ